MTEVIFCDFDMAEKKAVIAPFFIKFGENRPKIKAHMCKKHQEIAEKMANAKNTKPLVEILIKAHDNVNKVLGAPVY